MPIYVFDAYGTLFDVHAAIGRHRTIAGPDADRLSEVWRSKQLEYSWTLTLAGTYTDFWTLTERALDYALARFPSVDPKLKTKFLDAYLSLDAYPDARATLAGLRSRGLQTAILSNGTPAMLDAAVRSAGLDAQFDAILSVDAVKMFKPRPEVYALVTGHFNTTASDVMFVSSNRWDIMGARAFGFSTMWVNRADVPNEYAEFPPLQTIHDLAALVHSVA